MRIDFYHLTRSGADAVLPQLAAKLLADGERLAVVANDPATLEALDTALWTHKAESFLPHAVAGAEGNDDMAEPILLDTTCAAPNAARNIALADGRWREEAFMFERVFYLFDASSIEAARTAWKSLATRDDAERHYWKQDEAGRWREGP